MNKQQALFGFLMMLCFSVIFPVYAFKGAGKITVKVATPSEIVAASGRFISANAVGCPREYCGGMINYKSWDGEFGGWVDHHIAFEVDQGMITWLKVDSSLVVSELDLPIQAFPLPSEAAEGLVTVVPISREKIGYGKKIAQK